jgi:hypothetical protein
VREDLDPERFPYQFEMLAKDIVTFASGLSQFPEYTDEAINASALDFEADLKVFYFSLVKHLSNTYYSSTGYRASKNTMGSSAIPLSNATSTTCPPSCPFISKP